MVDVYQWRRFFKSNRDLQTMRYSAVKTLSLLIFSLSFCALFCFVANFEISFLRILMSSLSIVLISVLLIQSYRYLCERNRQAKTLIKENALELLYLSFKVFDKNEYVLKNLNESYNLDVMSRKSVIPKRMYFDYITCCRELVFRLSLYKKTNEKVPGTFSEEIDKMFKAANI